MTVGQQPCKGLTVRGRAALALGSVAAWASRKAGRGEGSVIGGRVTGRIAPSILSQLASGKRTVLVTGTNGKSTTTRMIVSALAEVGAVATNSQGSNMEAGLIAALASGRKAPYAVLEVDELHLASVAKAVQPAVVVLLNLSRDQLDRVGEIGKVERSLRDGLAALPETAVVANCDDVLVTSVAYDAPHVVWVAAGGSWQGDSVSCPRTGTRIARVGERWSSATGAFTKPDPQWLLCGDELRGPGGFRAPMRLGLPGAVNRGNAAEAVAAASALGADPFAALRAIAEVREVGGRYGVHEVAGRAVRKLLAKNPAGWQESLSMVEADSVVIAVNGRVADGGDLSWLWDVPFEQLRGKRVLVSGERAADLSVRLDYAGVAHELCRDPFAALKALPPGRVDLLANYTAFMELKRCFEKRIAEAEGRELAHA
ncbi:MurT ligase domain-containing protein [Segniliparus rugosus]|uniref:Lipid II isoglutaminyl synthase (glutamine-hydrolyzing) subunit MurT n=1 Tax=Segniliparus rugosus (strain ATCC BAA-974 / DSM 45345 / CCUG 50838 / CIP 108380 / JCM 13579 / CDC 945) TaxID=679197 RepID=U1M2Q7_SEGRC|nr:MurT ligase domain-containing protein [Segniliparus rugosus]ERG69395.1 hypothetical protein HMPREF9336_04091 [Segniliparus rugosus ATCC BAA-974]